MASKGWRTAFPEVYQVPRIAGQHEAYLVKALQEYRNGDRSHPSMRAIAASLSDKDMADVAAYYAQSRPVDEGEMMIRRNLTLAAAALVLGMTAAHAANLDAGKAKAAEVCAACHGADGNSPSPDFPKLAGQHRDYLAKALRDYKSGARKNAIMQGFAAALTTDDIDNLAAYYSAQPAVVFARY